MEICTIGFTHKSAAQFFGLLRTAGIKRLVDIRLHNVSQLAGFTRRDDLEFFLRELCDAAYLHEPLLAPTEEIFKAYRASRDWQVFMDSYRALITERKVETLFTAEFFATPTVLLCSEAEPDHCHRRVAAEYLQGYFDLMITHL